MRDLLYRPKGGPVVVGFANEGGGTRKTNGAVNIAVELAHRGLKTWLADGDQTMAASCYLGYGVTNKKHNPAREKAVYARLEQMTNIYDVLHGRATLAEATVPARHRSQPAREWDFLDDDSDDCFTVIPNLRLVLGSRAMVDASNDITNPRKGRGEQWLRRAIKDVPAGEVDVICVDFRGTFDILEYSEVAACDFIVGCVKPDTKDDDTLTSLTRFLESAKERFEFSGGAADLRYVMINGTQPKNRGSHFGEIVEDIKSFYDDRVLPTISESVIVGESVRYQEAVRYYCDSEDDKPVQEFKAVADVLEPLLKR
ncbi:ParA family protein [Kitasatospora sp. NPDC002965]|uniref:ParA family protein n=1 Tax=Kitasatospora sp. NPDC002965 TaxID=3154775 RepID=UPI00339E2F5E